MSTIVLPDWFIELDPVVQALLAGTFTWLVTALGAATVFLKREIPRAVLDAMLGFAAGVMIAASFWSLLNPAIALAEEQGVAGWLPAVVGFLAGGAFLGVTDQILPHLHPGMRMSQAEGIPTTWQRTTLLVLAITLHNIPEGLAVGVAFGAASMVGASDITLLSGAVALAIGIGLQNFPEGLAVAMPLRREGVERTQAFWYGQLSALVEPFAAVAGALAVVLVRPMLPYALAFAAGAMIYVVVEELIPESQMSKRTDLATSATMLGFAVMMWLDVALG
jgi:ZIP family zinc transporter